MSLHHLKHVLAFVAKFVSGAVVVSTVVLVGSLFGRFKPRFLVSFYSYCFWRVARPFFGPCPSSLSSANYFNVFCHVTLKSQISGVIYSSISSYTSFEREKNTLLKKKYSGQRKPIIFRHKKIKKAYLHKNFLKF